jgi:hypothetical protein
MNPLYGVEDRDTLGNVRLCRSFPAAFYEEQHVESRDYLPETAEVPWALWATWAGGKRGSAVERLIEPGVVMGLRKCYRYDRG